MLFKLLALALPLLSNALVLPRCGSGCGSVSAMLADITFVQNVVNFEICIISIDARRAGAVLGHSYGPLLTCSEPLNPNYIIQLNTVVNVRTTTNQVNVQTINNIQTTTNFLPTTTASVVSTTTTTTSSTTTILSTTTTSTSTTSVSVTISTAPSIPIQTIGLISGVIQIVQTNLSTNTAPGAILYVGQKSVPQPSDADSRNPPGSPSSQAVGGGNQMVANQVDALKVYLSAPMGTCASITADYLNIYAPMVENLNTQFQYFGLGSNSATDGENNFNGQRGDIGLFGPVAQTPFGPPTQGGFASYGNNFYAESQIWLVDCSTHILQANYQSVNPGVHNGPTGPQKIIVNSFMGLSPNSDGVVYTNAYTKFVIQGNQQSNFIFVPDAPGFF